MNVEIQRSISGHEKGTLIVSLSLLFVGKILKFFWEEKMLKNGNIMLVSFSWFWAILFVLWPSDGVSQFAGDVENAETYEVTSGVLYMGGNVFFAPFDIVSDGYVADVSGRTFSRFVDYGKWSDERKQRYLKKEFTSRDLLLAVCDSITFADNTGKSSIEIGDHWQKWVNEKLVSVGQEPISIKYNSIDGVLFVDRGKRTRPEILKVLDKETHLARKREIRSTSHKQTLRIIVDMLQNNWVVAWGKDYTAFFDPKEDLGIGQILTDISLGVFPDIVPEERAEFGLENILGHDLQKQFIFDLVNPEK